jgi:hypothetical protein
MVCLLQSGAIASNARSTVRRPSYSSAATAAKCANPKSTKADDEQHEVTVNRSLRALRAQRLANFGNGRLTISDFKQLAHIGDFDDTYLRAQVQLLR